MSMSPQQMQQMLAQYKQQFPNTAQPVPNLMPPPNSGFTGAPAPMGTGGQISKGAAATQGTAQLIAALMKAQKQKQIQTQLDQQQVNQNMPALSNQSLQATNDMTNQMLQQNPIAPVVPGQ